MGIHNNSVDISQALPDDIKREIEKTIQQISINEQTVLNLRQSKSALEAEMREIIKAVDDKKREFDAIEKQVALLQEQNVEKSSENEHLVTINSDLAEKNKKLLEEIEENTKKASNIYAGLEEKERDLNVRENRLIDYEKKLNEEMTRVGLFVVKIREVISQF